LSSAQDSNRTGTNFSAGATAAQSAMLDYRNVSETATVSLQNSGYLVPSVAEKALASVPEINSSLEIVSSAGASVCGGSSGTGVNLTALSNWCGKFTTNIELASSHLKEGADIAAAVKDGSLGAQNATQATILVTASRIDISNADVDLSA